VEGKLENVLQPGLEANRGGVGFARAVSLELDCQRSGKLKTTLIFISKYNKPDWPYNFNFWTSGALALPGQWSWCVPGQSPLAMDENLPWEEELVSLEAKKKECAHLKIGRNATGIRLTAKNCSSKFIFGCQVVKY